MYVIYVRVNEQKNGSFSFTVIINFLKKEENASFSFSVIKNFRSRAGKSEFQLLFTRFFVETEQENANVSFLSTIFLKCRKMLISAFI